MSDSPFMSTTGPADAPGLLLAREWRDKAEEYRAERDRLLRAALAGLYVHVTAPAPGHRECSCAAMARIALSPGGVMPLDASA